MRRLFLLLGIVLFITGCGLDPVIDDQHAGQNDPRHKGNHMDSDLKEGEITDIADMNPNFLDTEPTNDGRTRSDGVYRDKLLEQVEASDKFDPQFVTINGKRATVHVKANGSYTKKDVSKLKEQLARSVPRYEIKVDVD